MRHLGAFVAICLVVPTMFLVFAAEQATPTAKKETPAAPKAPPAPVPPPSAAAAPSADELAIRQNTAAYVAAFDKGDAAELVKCFTVDAEYIDEAGEVVQGRPAIQESVAQDFAEHPGLQLALEVETLRMISPGVATEDGSATVTDAEGTVLAYNHYNAVIVKVDGHWLLASVREHAPKDRREHRTQLQQLDWLLGEWVDLSPISEVHFSCSPSDDGNFLVRTFTVHMAGEPLFHGTQWIGWDPLTKHVRSWTFDSDGGFSSGVWHQSGDVWQMKSTGVTADGEQASSTSIYTLESDHVMKWQVVDQEVAGASLPDGEIITVVARPPVPESPGPAKTK